MSYERLTRALFGPVKPISSDHVRRAQLAVERLSQEPARSKYRHGRSGAERVAILAKLFGIGEPTLSPADVAVLLGVSDTRVNQIKRQTLRRLRALMQDARDFAERGLFV